MASIEEAQKINQQDRNWFIKFWVNYMKKTPNKVCSSQQKKIIDPQFQNALQNPMSKELFLKMKVKRQF